MKKGAQFSDDRIYRYALWRTWDSEGSRAMFIGLNPSTADEYQDDPTIRRCIGFANLWGYGGISMLNLFAFCSTDPRKLRDSDIEPIGKENNQLLRMYGEEAGIIVACWGNGGEFAGRSNEVRQLLSDMPIHHFGLTNKQQPCHPLYLKRNAIPVLWEKS